MTSTDRVPAWRPGLLLWAAGMPGIVLVTVTALPRLLENTAAPAPVWVLQLASFAQSGIILGLAVWAGVALASEVGLRAPVFQAVAIGGSPWRPLRPQLLPGVVAGLLGGAMLVAAGRIAPVAIKAAQEKFSLPIGARVLYGGITEELLLRWGLMTVFVWLAWRFLQQRQGAVHGGFVWLAIVVSSLLFGAGHLPAAFVLLGGLDATAVTYVVGVNTLFGVIFGWLYWQRGLESAMLAHGLSHVLHYLMSSH